MENIGWKNQMPNEYVRSSKRENKAFKSIYKNQTVCP